MSNVGHKVLSIKACFNLKAYRDVYQLEDLVVDLEARSFVSTFSQPQATHQTAELPDRHSMATPASYVPSSSDFWPFDLLAKICQSWRLQK